MSYVTEAIKPQGAKKRNDSQLHYLAQKWAQKYVLAIKDNEIPPGECEARETSEKLQTSLRAASVEAWSLTEKLIAKEVWRHGINPRLINPWEIAEDIFRLYEKAIETYTLQIHPLNLTRTIAPEVGNIRQKYTAEDPRVIGFVSMQFHYTGQQLLQRISPWEQERVKNYFKVIDDHLYMPLQRAYRAAAKHNEDSEALMVVQQLLPVSSDIAKNICERVIKLYPNYCTRNGLLQEEKIKISSIRDTEMFQVYLWVCLLEGNMSVIFQELFPLCVMLYPALKVQWELIRQMLHLLGKETCNNLGSEQQNIFLPYFQVLWQMFSPEVFPETLEDEF
jgi:Phycobilisome protein